MLETMDAAAVRRWCGGGLEALRAHQHEIDELNVYPVPDGDTGTNLVLTLTSAQHELDAVPPDPEPAEPTPHGRALRRMARGALLGARGNSGVIVSQILRGMADSLATSVAVRGGELARALHSASEAAYAAVARPVEGTVLSVVAAAADGAGRIKSDDLLVVARAAARAASEALARTPQQLPVLARAGVVDAGGRGLCLLLDALVVALTPSDATEPDPASAPSTATSTRAVPLSPPPATAHSSSAAGAAVGDSAALGAASSSPSAVVGAAVGDSAVSGAASSLPSAVVGAAFADSGVSGAPSPSPSAVAGVGLGADAGSAAQGAGPASSATSVGAPVSPVAGGLAAGSGGLGGQLGRGAAAEPGDDPGHGGSGFGYEVQYLLETDDATAAGLRVTLDRLGDSLVIVGTGDGTWNVHVHVGAADIGPAVEAGVVAGRPHRISVTPLEPGRPHTVPAADPLAAEAAALAEQGRGAVVVAAGDGLTALFRAEGATVVDRNPSIREMIEAIKASGTGSVVLLPNDSNTHAVASAAAREAEAAGVRVSVVPTRSPVQALAALAVRDRGRPFADDVIAMAEAAGACRYGEVCTAQRDSLTVAGPCRAGDLLGLVDGEVHVIGTDLEDVSRRLLDRMLGGGGELATLVLGAAAPAALEETLRDHVTHVWPFVELECYAGGQPRYHLLVGVE